MMAALTSNEIIEINSPSSFRELPGSGARINPGEFVLYHFVSKTMVRCTPDGAMQSRYNEMGYVFDSLAEAQRYGQWKAAECPKLGCTIYDSDRKFADQIFSNQHIEKTRRGNDPKRLLGFGLLLLVGGVLLIWLDFRHDWMLIIGFLVGARLAVGGLVKIGLGLLGLRTPPSDAT